jgi:hypothetical protein
MTTTPRVRRLAAGLVPLAVTVALAGPSAAHAAPVTIDTFPVWNGTDDVFFYGPAGTPTYGQVVTVPAGAKTLREFAFALSIPTDVVSRAEVYAWDGARATGDALYESAPFSTTLEPVNAASGDRQYQTASFSIPDAPVVAGRQYVLFLSVNRDVSPRDVDGGFFGAVSDAAYADGTFVYGNGYDVQDWTTETWATDYGYDLAFRATFDDGVAPAGPDAPATPVAPTPPVLAPVAPVAPPVVTVPPARDTTPQRISDVRVSPRQVRFRLAEPGAARVFVSKRVVTRTGSGSTRRSVVSYRRVAALRVTKRYAGVAGLRLAKPLTDGRYRVSITARDAAGNAAKPVRVYTKP